MAQTATLSRVSTQEKISHAVRRLGIGANPALVRSAGDVASAIAASLDLSGEPEPLPDVRRPRGWEDREEDREKVFRWWLEAMVTSRHPIRERLTWFWHDHFATSIEKVEAWWLMWQQHLLLREHGTGNFATLLRAVSRDPAMLVYLDGAESTAEAPNENFGREVMELYTLGVGHYTEDDVKAAARAFTGWMVNWPGERKDDFEWEDEEPWGPVFDAEYHDSSRKTLLGVTGNLDMDGALDILLDRPETGERVAAKLFAELVGFPPDDATRVRLGRSFGADYEIMPLVEAIVAEPAFVSDEAVRTRVRTPIEKLVSLLQGFRREEEFEAEYAFYWLEMLGYAPFLPPNPAGFPKGGRLLSPGHLTGAFSMLNALPEPERRMGADELFERFGIYDVSPATRDVVASQRHPGMAIALAFGSPEFALT